MKKEICKKNLKKILLQDYQVFKENNYLNFVFKKNKKFERQGWKIHISAKYSNYKKIFKIASEILIEKHVSFKVINSSKKILESMTKKNSILSVGKFITIYPKNTKEFIKIIEILYNALLSFDGIDVNTDKRYKDSKNVFYRYGVKICSSNEKFLIYKRKKILDERSLIKYHPYFVKDLFSFTNYNKIDNFENLNNKFNLEYCLDKNSGGSVFYGNYKKNKINCILKQTKKNIMSSPKETLIEKREYECFLIKNNLDLKTPKVLESFYESNGDFWVVKEFIAGKDLLNFKSQFSIFFNNSFTKIDFFSIYLNILERLVNIFKYFHKKNIILNDVKLNNFLITKEMDLYFIDPEHSYLENEYDKSKFKINSTYQSNLFSKYTHKSLDKYKLGMLIVDIICDVQFFLKFFKNLQFLKKYLKDIFNYFNFSKNILEILLQLIFNSNNINFTKIESVIEKERKNYFLNFNYSFDFLTINLLKKKINLNSKFPIKEIDIFFSLENFSDYIFFYENFSSLNNDKKTFFEKKLKEKRKENFFFELLFIVFKNKRLLTKKRNYIIEKINSYIKENVFFNNYNYSVKQKNYFSPYIKDGISGLIILLIYLRNKFNIQNFDNLILNVSKTLSNPFLQKVNFDFGILGIAFMHIKIYEEFKTEYSLKSFFESFYFLISQKKGRKIYDAFKDKFEPKDFFKMKFVAKYYKKYEKNIQKVLKTN